MATGTHGALTGSFFPCSFREALLAEMGVAMREDGGTLGVFSPKKVGSSYFLLPGKQGLICNPTAPFQPALSLLASPKYFSSFSSETYGGNHSVDSAGYEHH